MVKFAEARIAGHAFIHPALEQRHMQRQVGRIIAVSSPQAVQSST
jgi:hypothetical protein